MRKIALRGGTPVPLSRHTSKRGRGPSAARKESQSAPEALKLREEPARPTLEGERRGEASTSQPSAARVGGGLLQLCRSFVDDRLAADPRFLLKLGIETSLDSACTFAAEVSSRGSAALGSQLPFVLDDLVTTVLLDCAIVSAIAPSASKAAHSEEHAEEAASEARLGHLVRWLREVLASLPNSCFEAPPAGGHYTPQQRCLAALATAVQYALFGLACGGAGQAVTDALASAGFAGGTGAAGLPGVWPVALLWARYMGGNASVRYQLVSALEGLAERSQLAATPAALTAVSAAARLGNNVYGAALFVEMFNRDLLGQGNLAG